MDGILPFYKILKENELENAPLNIVLQLSSDCENSAHSNLIQLIRDIFHVNQLIVITPSNKRENLVFDRLVLHKGVPIDTPYFPNDLTFAFYSACPESIKYMHELKEQGFCDNLVYRGTPIENSVVADFVSFIKGRYHINIPMKKGRVLFVERKSPQKIINQKSLVKTLKTHGYDVQVVDFENLSIKNQILAVAQSEYLIGVYGSNLVNAIFLDPNSKVMILWPQYAKYFWSRRYCIIHSAFLSLGVTLIEFDKPDHPLDSYSCTNLEPNYFYRIGNKVCLKDEKKNLDAIINYPWPASFELRTVNQYIDPKDFLKVFHKLE
ncbi:MAG: glycosyltransferase family 61 protein [Chlamydiia bacterium]|nr:glycosyltransferase family 61 protein [Chlamydiia bacterium]